MPNTLCTPTSPSSGTHTENVSIALTFDRAPFGLWQDITLDYNSCHDMRPTCNGHD